MIYISKKPLKSCPQYYAVMLYFRTLTSLSPQKHWVSSDRDNMAISDKGDHEVPQLKYPLMTKCKLVTVFACHTKTDCFLIAKVRAEII